MSHSGIELSIIVPTYNEKENIAELIARVAACLEDHTEPSSSSNSFWEIIFVDDDSPDGTADLVRSLGQGDRRIRCIQRIDRRGLSSACIEGMLASSAPYLAVMDADLQHDERLLPRMLEVLRAGAHDLVIGSRYVDGGSVGNWDPLRTSISRWATKVGHLVLRVPLSDPMSGFFMLRRATFRNTVRHLSGVGFKLLFDIVASAPQPLQVQELPYTFRTRQFGESKLDGQVGWEYVLLLLDKFLGPYVPVRFLSFALIGGLGIAVHLLILTFLFEGMNMTFVQSQTVATLTAMTTNFALNNILTYRDMRLRGWRWLRGWLSFSMACSIGALANIGIAAHLFEKGIAWMLAALAGILVSAVWNYAMTMVYTWKKPSTA